MPASASSHRPEALIARLSTADGEAKLRALRELKNQIIGNRTKKLSYIKLGAVPAVVAALSAASAGGDTDAEAGVSLLVQSAAALGSFACGVDVGVKAVLDAGAFPRLLQLISHPNDKVVDASARSLRMIYQSKLAPKYDFLQGKNVEFLISLLNSANENLVGLGVSIITHSCQTSTEQKALCDAGALKKLISLLEGSLNQRDATLESLAIIIKNNAEVISNFVEPESGRALNAVTELTKDRYPRTRLLACICLIVIRNSSPCYLQDVGIKTKLILILLELLDDPSQVGDEACFALSSLIAEKEDLQKLAFEADAVDKLGKHLERDLLQPKRIQGILLALADLCLKLECCRSRLLQLQVLNLVTDALTHNSAEVRVAACICLKSVSRSVKNLSAGHFMTETIVMPLVQLLHDPSTSVQGMYVLSNVATGNEFHKEAVMHQILAQAGNSSQSVMLKFLQSNDSQLRTAAIWAIVNLIFPCSPGAFSRLVKLRDAGIVSQIKNMIEDPCLDVKVINRYLNSDNSSLLSCLLNCI
ncbi:uncharacterized protein LOC131147850 isoform X4 [Malania oleifera]|uniref:uncharacterized protein LOC131147850 isoform X4 n=1 Tax=Malania oleifera TaxID=397392 RepID=UPI0025ADC3BD|nr:uncharacterized protein LOC131147850 isoform X4 [Malania oleifera]